MRSSRFKIMLQLDSLTNASNPHNNQTNSTIIRLREALQARHLTELNVTMPESANTTSPVNVTVLEPANMTLAMPANSSLASGAFSTSLPAINETLSGEELFPVSNYTYLDTLTGPDSHVYRVQAGDRNDIEAFIFSLARYNVTHGGNCTDPSEILYSNTFCADFNATIDRHLCLQGCDGQTALTGAMLFIANNATALCAAPASDDSHAHRTHLIVASVILGLMMAAVAGLALASRYKSKQIKQNVDSDDEDSHQYEPVPTNRRGM